MTRLCFLFLSCNFVPLCDMESWTGEHRVSAAKMYFKNNDSVVASWRIFRRHFNLRRHKNLPDGRSVRRWISSFRLTASTCNWSPGGSEEQCGQQR